MANELPLPELRLNDDNVDFPEPVVDDWAKPKLPSLSVIRTSGDQSAAELIEERFWQHIVGRDYRRVQQEFWPSKLIDHLLDKDAVYNVVKQLVTQGTLPDKIPGEPRSVSSASSYWTERVMGTTASPRTTYCRVLIVLIFVRKTNCLKRFLDEKVSDQKLHQEALLNPLLEDWKTRDASDFDHYRSKVLVPFLEKSRQPGQVSHHEFDLDSVLPWKILRSNTSPLHTLSGGYGEVNKIVIHAWQHDFHADLEQISAPPSLFALKRLHTSDEGAFRAEVSELKRFGGRHPHIVTLLCTVIHRKRDRTDYHLLFPWAEYDLLTYWEREASQKRDCRFFKWVAEQLVGMADALKFIHDPNFFAGEKRLYGRHGDIKPENILCFKGNGRGTLVLSDLGLTKAHGDQSRSNRPGEQIPVTPNYRPPECDIDGRDGHVSRDFDIWTLGCIFLEFMVWILDGWEGYKGFRDRRFSPYINGVDTCVYFEIVRVPEEEGYAFKIKDVVTKEIERLHAHPGCTEYVHDMLELIHERMIFVRSDGVYRIPSPKLEEELQAMKKKCENSDYCVRPCPRNTQVKPRPPVRASLNTTAKRYIAEDHRYRRVDLYRGETSAYRG
ncbi:Serine/threonine-protein kinase SSN3 [Colletotrichum tanaceti]|nr:Serine/threonine-protein kinase SSN3 [Colletotrichum tanaceti]